MRKETIKRTKFTVRIWRKHFSFTGQQRLNLVMNLLHKIDCIYFIVLQVADVSYFNLRGV